MLIKRLTVFIAKRLLICCILLSIVDMVFVKQKWYVFFGMLLGAVVSLIRFGSYGFAFGRIFSVNIAAPRKVFSVFGSLSVFAINQIVLLPLLYIAYKYNVYFFVGVFAGIMILPFVLLINCLTEALGITHNNFD